MRLPLLTTLCLLAGCATAPAKHSEAASPPAAPTPAPSPASPAEALRPIEYMVGHWHCVSANLDIAYNVERELGGAFFAGEVTAHRIASKDAEPITARDSWGFDSVSREFFRAYRGGDGTFGIMRTHGWEGTRLVFLGDASSNGERTPLRETIERLSPDRMNARWESRSPEGKWTVYSDELCTRAP